MDVTSGIGDVKGMVAGWRKARKGEGRAGNVGGQVSLLPAGVVAILMGAPAGAAQ
jgi:hypothetical protein